MNHDTSNELTTPSPKKSSTPNTEPIRVKRLTAKKVRSLVKKLNKKTMGKKVIADDVIAMALSLLNDTHLEEIRRSTYSSQDRLEIRFQEHCKAHGNVSMDQFLELLMESSLPLKTKL